MEGANSDTDKPLNDRTWSAVSQGAAARADPQARAGWPAQHVGGSPGWGDTGSRWRCARPPRPPCVRAPGESWGGGLPTGWAAPRSAVRWAEPGKEVGGARLQEAETEKGGETLGPVYLEARKVRPACLQQLERTRCVDVSPGARATSPGSQPDPCLQMGTSTRKLPKAPNCPASRGRSWDGRDSQPFQDVGAGWGASRQSPSVQSRTRKKESRRMNCCCNKAALQQSPGPGATRLLPPRGKASPLRPSFCLPRRWGPPRRLPRRWGSHRRLPGRWGSHRRLPRRWRPHRCLPRRWGSHRCLPRRWGSHRCLPRCWGRQCGYTFG